MSKKGRKPNPERDVGVESSNLLRQWYVASKLTYQQFSDLLGVPLHSVTTWLNGIRQPKSYMMRYFQLRLICAGVDVQPNNAFSAYLSNMSVKKRTELLNTINNFLKEDDKHESDTDISTDV